MAGDGLPIKQIVRVTGLNRNLVRQILRGEREDAFRLPANRAKLRSVFPLRVNR